MSAQPKLFMPVIPPPEIDQSNPSLFYTTLNAKVAVDDPASGRGLQITIQKPDDLLPSDQFATPRKLSTVYSLAKGLVSFYPSAANLPTPDGQPMAVPPEMANLDIGTVIQQIWPSDYRKLRKTVSPPDLPSTHVAYAGLDRLSVEAAFKKLVLAPRIPTKALIKSWKQTGGSGSTPSRTILEDLFVQRAMSGDGSIYVEGGSPLGSAAKISIIPVGETAPVSVGRFLLQTYATPPQPTQSVFTDTETIPDDIFGLEARGSTNLYAGHPFVDSNDPVGPVQFKPTFTIWNNITHAYEPLAGYQVYLRRIDGNTDQIIASPTTAVDGTIDISVDLSRRARIRFEAVVKGNKIGDRDFTENLQTDEEKVKTHLDATRINTFTYKLKYRVAEAYTVFYEGLRSTVADEPYGQDRGNSDDHNIVSREFTDSLLKKMVDCEDYYAGTKPYDVPGMYQGAFNILFEGDSWFSYPFPGRDAFSSSHIDDSIFVHLDDRLDTHFNTLKLKYNRIPLQHHGDRSDQMFGRPMAQSTPLQWEYTQEFLKEYKFDLLILSAGGNDFAEPGMSNYLPGPPSGGKWLLDFSKGGKVKYPNFYTGNIFDTTCIDSTTSTDLRSMFERKLDSSCAALLKNHPWNLYLRGIPVTNQSSAAHLTPILDGFLTALSLNPARLSATGGDSDADVLAAATDVITCLDGLPLTFPDNAPSDVYSQLLSTVFDQTRFRQRYEAVKANLEVLLQFTRPMSLKVLTHTYCYPIFNQSPTTTGLGNVHLAGPWFEPRFNEANIKSRLVRMVCLKAMIDNHVRLVLEPLKNDYAPYFDYVEVRKMNADPKFWNDEMHLTNTGFAAVAQAIINHATTKGWIP